MITSLRIIQTIVNNKYASKSEGPFKPIVGFYKILEITSKKGHVLPTVYYAEALWKASRNKKFVDGAENKIILAFLFSSDCQYPKALSVDDLKGKVLEIKYTDYKDGRVILDWDICDLEHEIITEDSATGALIGKKTLSEFLDRFMSSQPEDIQDAIWSYEEIYGSDIVIEQNSDFEDNVETLLGDDTDPQDEFHNDSENDQDDSHDEPNDDNDDRTSPNSDPNIN